MALILALGLGGGAVYLVQRSLRTEMLASGTADAIMYLPSPKIVKRFSLGFEGALADLYWIRTLQYYGRRALRPGHRFDWLKPLLDMVTELDPRFITAYRFGAVFLALAPPAGPGQPEAALALLDRGIERNPDEWRLILDKGAIYAWNMHDYETAARLFERASRHRRAPAWVADLAAGMYTKAGRRDAARRIWRDRYEHGENEYIRRRAAWHLDCLRALEEVERLHRLLSRYRRRSGRWPRSWDELIAVGLIARAPVDPRGYPYRLEPHTGRISLSEESPLVLPQL